jgi:hypothetical protein
MATPEVNYLAELAAYLRALLVKMHNKDDVPGRELVVHITTLLVSISTGQFNSTNSTGGPTCAEVWRKTISACCMRLVVAGSSVR